MLTVKLHGLEDTVSGLASLSRATGRNTLRRALTTAGQPVADMAAELAPSASGRLAFSIVVSTQLTRRQRREGKRSEAEVYIGPAGGTGALNYASFKEFGTINMPADPFMRPAWEARKSLVLETIKVEFRAEIGRAAARAARRAARLARG